MELRTREFFYPSNLLSLSRIIIIIPIIWLIRVNTATGNYALFALTLLGIATDYLDGFVSRKLNQVTDLGKALDPVADKICMALAMIALIVYRQFPIPLVVFLIYRDVIILLFSAIALRKDPHPVAANIFGKANTAIISLVILLFMMEWSGWFRTFLLLLGYASIFVSGISYAFIGERIITKSRNLKALYRIGLIVLTALIVYAMTGFRFIY
jgi:CDP-diacylglycerol--glycerol-3-phosphate 3-phosphatidyltransferase